MRIIDWSSDVCSSVLGDVRQILIVIGVYRHAVGIGAPGTIDRSAVGYAAAADQAHAVVAFAGDRAAVLHDHPDRTPLERLRVRIIEIGGRNPVARTCDSPAVGDRGLPAVDRSDRKSTRLNSSY